MEGVVDIRDENDQVARAVEALPKFIEYIKDSDLRVLCSNWLADYGSQFYKGFGSAVDTSHHHAYPGGLLVHTTEVMGIASYHAGMPYLDRVNRDVVMTAAFFHDVAKIWDYDAEGQKTRYRKLVRHVNGSHVEFLRCVNGVSSKIPDDIVENIEHCILAHHGRPEWGSPVEPQTIEAHILHYADNLSARYGVYR